MCTLTWIKNDSSYEVFFNRDELLSRIEEIPPSLHRQGDMQFLAPIDPQGQGTWVGVNEMGITLCMVNLYPSERMKGAQYKSRGRLLWSLLSCLSLEEVNRELNKMNLQAYLGFRIVGFSLNEKTLLIRWNQADLEINKDADKCYPITSSSFKSQEVEGGRLKFFDETVRKTPVLTAEILDKYQQSTYPQLSVYSVCMKRVDACTKSYSRIRVDQKNISFAYQPYPWQEPKNKISLLNLKLK